MRRARPSSWRAPTARSATRAVGDARIEQACRRAAPAVIDVLQHYPTAPPGGGRVGELLRALDAALRRRS
jgi:hypothetical protein